MIWYWMFGVLMTALFWGLIIWAVAYLWGLGRRRRPGPAGQWQPWGGGSPSGGGPGPWDGPGPRHEADPEEILARRFAAGEIDEEEYHRRMEALRPRQYAAPPAPPTATDGRAVTTRRG